MLRLLKITHTAMASEYIRLEDSLQAGYYLDRVLYGVDLLYDYWMTSFEIGRAYFADGLWRPFLAMGFVMINAKSEYLHCSFDLSPFYLGYEYPEYSGYSEIDVSEIYTEPLKTAAAFYNECVEEFFEKGFFVIPSFYVEALAGYYPPEEIERAIVVEI